MGRNRNRNQGDTTKAQDQQQLTMAPATPPITEQQQAAPPPTEASTPPTDQQQDQGQEQDQAATEEAASLEPDDMTAPIPMPNDLPEGWSPELVDAIFAEAAMTLRRLPDRDKHWLASAERSGWPATLKEAAEEFALAVERTAAGEQPYETPRLRSQPTAAMITRLDMAMDWLAQLSKHDMRAVRIIWARACGVRWGTICGKMQLGRTRAWAVWVAALTTISDRMKAERKDAPHPSVIVRG